MNIIGDPIIAANTGSDEIVIISDSQPTEEDNKLWVKNTLTGEGVEIPTMSDLASLGLTVIDGKLCAVYSAS